MRKNKTTIVSLFDKGNCMKCSSCNTEFTGRNYGSETKPQCNECHNDDVYNRYRERRNDLCKIRDDSIDGFDKTILAICTGALALSITFLDKIGRPFNTLTFLLIAISWVAMLLVLVFNLTSYYFAGKNMDCKITDLDLKYKEGKTDNPEYFSKYRTLTHLCNNLCLILFIISSISFTSYIILIQKNNYNLLRLQKSFSTLSMEDSTMTKKVTAGKTEQAQPLAKLFNEGKTELPQIVNRGKTEPPQQQPKKPVGNPDSQSQVNSSTTKNNY